MRLAFRAYLKASRVRWVRSVRRDTDEGTAVIYFVSFVYTCVGDILVVSLFYSVSKVLRKLITRRHALSRHVFSILTVYRVMSGALLRRIGILFMQITCFIREASVSLNVNRKTDLNDDKVRILDTTRSPDVGWSTILRILHF